LLACFVCAHACLEFARLRSVRRRPASREASAGDVPASGRREHDVIFQLMIFVDVYTRSWTSLFAYCSSIMVLYGATVWPHREAPPPRARNHPELVKEAAFNGTASNVAGYVTRSLARCTMPVDCRAGCTVGLHFAGFSFGRPCSLNTSDEQS